MPVVVFDRGVEAGEVGFGGPDVTVGCGAVEIGVETVTACGVKTCKLMYQRRSVEVEKQKVIPASYPQLNPSFVSGGASSPSQSAGLTYV